jgi:hypothetical protein
MPCQKKYTQGTLLEAQCPVHCTVLVEDTTLSQQFINSYFVPMEAWCQPPPSPPAGVRPVITQYQVNIVDLDFPWENPTSDGSQPSYEVYLKYNSSHVWLTDKTFVTMNSMPVSPWGSLCRRSRAPVTRKWWKPWTIIMYSLMTRWLLLCLSRTICRSWLLGAYIASTPLHTRWGIISHL